jgi:hypothetical protein
MRFLLIGWAGRDAVQAILDLFAVCRFENQRLTQRLAWNFCSNVHTAAIRPSILMA